MYLSEDGLDLSYTTNVKALHALAIRSQYKPIIISYSDRADNVHKQIDFNYKNLLKALEANSGGGKYYTYCTLECESGAEIRIQEHKIFKG